MNDKKHHGLFRATDDVIILEIRRTASDDGIGKGLNRYLGVFSDVSEYISPTFRDLCK